MITKLYEYKKIDPNMFDKYVGNFYIKSNNRRNKNGFNLIYVKSITYKNGWFYLTRLISPFRYGVDGGISDVGELLVNFRTSQVRKGDIVEALNRKKIITPEDLVKNYTDIVLSYYDYLKENPKNKSNQYVLKVLRNVENFEMYINANKYNL